MPPSLLLLKTNHQSISILSFLVSTDNGVRLYHSWPCYKVQRGKGGQLWQKVSQFLNGCVACLIAALGTSTYVTIKKKSLVLMKHSSGYQNDTELNGFIKLPWDCHSTQFLGLMTRMLTWSEESLVSEDLIIFIKVFGPLYHLRKLQQPLTCITLHFFNKLTMLSIFWHLYTNAWHTYV